MPGPRRAPTFRPTGPGRAVLIASGDLPPRQQDGDFRDTLDLRLLAVTYQGAVDNMLGYLDAYPDNPHARTPTDREVYAAVGHSAPAEGRAGAASCELCATTTSRLP